MKYNDISKYISAYATTGVIDDALVPFYDQHGKWRGCGARWRHKTSSSMLEKIQTSHLPAWRRTRKHRSGITLRTAFYWSSSEPASLRYRCVEGSLIVSRDVMIHAARLRHVGGDFITSSSQCIHLPRLASVAGTFEVMKSFSVSAPRLRHVGGNVTMVGPLPPSLEIVEGRLGIYGYGSVESSWLIHVGGSLVISTAETARFPLLESVDGDLLMTHPSKIIDVPRLRIVGGDFLVSQVTDIRAPRLLAVAGDLNTACAKEFYHPRIKIGGQWTVCRGAVEHWMKREAARIALRGNQEPLWL